MGLMALALMGTVWAAEVHGSVSLLYYVLPGPDGYMGAVARADFGAAHLEARYNYEWLRTAALFVGGRGGAGDLFGFDVLVLVGALVGELSGATPEIQLTLWAPGVYWYSENQWCFDFSTKGYGYGYTWNEVVADLVGPFKVGFVLQRSAVPGVDTDWAYGALVRLTDGTVGTTVHILNIGPHSTSLLLSVRSRY